MESSAHSFPAHNNIPTRQERMASSTLLSSSQKAPKTTQNKEQIPEQQQQQQQNGKQPQDDSSEDEREKEDEFQNRPRQKAINSLEPVLHILERFHHRNKNQHRRSKWWSVADMFRRQLRKFIEALHDGLAEEERDVRILARSGKNPTSGAGKKNNLEDGLFTQDKFGIYERGVYLRGVLVPRGWFAFSQVVADQQFAQLGLMLLATLAQVDKVVSVFAPGPGVDEESEEDVEDSVNLARDQEISFSRESIINEGVAEDVGVAISREEFIMTTMSVRKGGAFAQGDERRTEETTIASRTVTVETGNDIGDEDEFAGFDDDASISTLDPTSAMETDPKKTPAAAVVGEEARTMKHKTKKTKKKRPRDEEEDKLSTEAMEDDDIGNIFASLAPTTKKKKKSTKATAATLPKSSVEDKPYKEPEDDNGDDIGDIFSSLIPKTKKKKPSVSASASEPTATSSKTKSKSKDKDKEKKKKKKRQGDEFDDIFSGLS